MDEDAHIPSEPVVIDLERIFWGSLVKAAAESSWIPTDYFMNDWVSDCCDFLRNGPSEYRGAK